MKNRHFIDKMGRTVDFIFVRDRAIILLSIRKTKTAKESSGMYKSKEISEVARLFTPIGLENMNRVKLMNRTDTKYWFHQDLLPEILDAVRKEYFILEIEGKNLLPYSTVYFDTQNDNMYLNHHNGRLNRYKVRRRKYLVSGISFLEVKFKTNKGKTHKSRIATGELYEDFKDGEVTFLNDNTPYDAEGLEPVLSNAFSRITLVNKNFKERCTIDLNLQFKAGFNEQNVENLVIVEIKSERKAEASALTDALKERHIHTSGFSKYCVGRALTDPSLKRNRLKQKLRILEKTIHEDYSNNPLTQSL